MAPSIAPLQGLVLGALLGLGFGALAGCSDTEDTRTLDAQQVALTAKDKPIYDDGELTLFEAKVAAPLPILRPSPANLAQLPRQAEEPYPRSLWVRADELKVQISWTISNLDREAHNVELLVDPWNEFGRYWPGLSLVDAEDGQFLPNLSGFDDLIEVPGTKSGKASRVSGTVTYSDTREMATDLATVMFMIKHPPMDVAGLKDTAPLVTLTNHAFHVLNRSENDPLVAPYIPKMIAGPTGFDVGLRTYEPANVALEFVVEVVREGENSPVLSDDDEAKGRPHFQTPNNYITVGTMP